MAVLYVVRTHPGNFDTKLAEQARTWMKEVNKTNIMISSSTNIGNDVNKTVEYLQHKLPTRIDKSQVLFWDCPNGHDSGPACTEAKALAQAYYGRHLEQGDKFDWVYVIDDDVLVFPKHLSQVLKTKDINMVHGVPGCEVQMSDEQIESIRGIFW